MNGKRMVKKLAALGCLGALFYLPAQAQDKTIEVGLFDDIGVGPHPLLVKALKEQPDMRLTILNGEDIRAGSLNRFDVFIAPGGSGRKEAGSLGQTGADEVRRFVGNGGCYMGICAGSYLASSSRGFLGLLPLNIRDRQHWHRGHAVLPVGITPKGREVLGIDSEQVKIVYHNGPVFDYRQPPDGTESLAVFRGEVVAPGGQPGVMRGAPAAVLGHYGRGLVLAISPHPEKTPGLYGAIPHAIRWLCRQPLVAERTLTETVNQTMPEPINQPAQSGPGDQPDNTGNDMSRNVYDTAMRIWQNAQIVQYRHVHLPASRQVVTLQDGRLESSNDCSGFVSYVIHAVAPRHYFEVASTEPGHAYPQARAYEEFFQNLSGDAGGWKRIKQVQDLQPGDIMAWRKAVSAEAHHGKHNSGHVMIVAGAPSVIASNGDESMVEIEVIDSSTVRHFGPEMLPPLAGQSARNGLGRGKVRLVVDSSGAPIAYWEGTYWGEGQKTISRPAYTREIAFARLLPFTSP